MGFCSEEAKLKARLNAYKKRAEEFHKRAQELIKAATSV